MIEGGDILKKKDLAFGKKTFTPKNKKKSTVRTVDQIEIRRRGDYVTLTFHGNGFLRNMVRILTGTLVAVGQGEMTAEQVKETLEAKDRLLAGATAPAKGLCLLEVDYM